MAINKTERTNDTQIVKVPHWLTHRIDFMTEIWARFEPDPGQIIPPIPGQTLDTPDVKQDYR